MKRIAILFVGLSLALAACGKKQPPAKPDSAKTEGEPDADAPKPEEDKPVDMPSAGGGW